MQHIKKMAAVKHSNNSQCHVFEYITADKDINIGVAELNGRYPEKGYAVNTLCKEIGYVMKGSGRLVTEGQVAILAEGDVVSISAGEKYYWEGEMTLLLPCAPAWHPEQHQTIVL